MKIAVTSKSFSNNKILIQSLKENFPNYEIILQQSNKNLNETELIEFLSDVELAIVGLDKINSNVLKSCPKLTRVAKYGVGLDNLNIEDCKKHNVTIGWTGGVNKLSVAEMALGFMLGLARNLFTSSFELKNGTWNKQGGYQLSEKTVGIIGVGHIGKEVIRLLKPFNCKILVNDIIDQEMYYQEVGVTAASKEEIFQACDIISFHTPLTQETENLVNIESVKNCKKKPFLINTARGGIFKETDLVSALDQGFISGVAIDAYVSEPLDIESIYKDKRIVTTPHIGGNAAEAVLAMGYSAIKNLKS